MIVDNFAMVAHLFGLNISLGKTEVLLQPAPSSTALPLSNSIKGTELKRVENFKYLRCVISSDGSLDREIKARICKASQDLGHLQLCVSN